jgi:hypothetical protein
VEETEEVMTDCRLARCSGLGFDWSTLIGEQIASWSKTGQQILQQQNIARGVYTTGPGGTTIVQPEGVAVPSGTANLQASPGFGVVLIGGAALLLVFMLARR